MGGSLASLLRAVGNGGYVLPPCCTNPDLCYQSVRSECCDICYDIDNLQRLRSCYDQRGYLDKPYSRDGQRESEGANHPFTMEHDLTHTNRVESFAKFHEKQQSIETKYDPFRPARYWSDPGHKKSSQTDDQAGSHERSTSPTVVVQPACPDALHKLKRCQRHPDASRDDMQGHSHWKDEEAGADWWNEVMQGNCANSDEHEKNHENVQRSAQALRKTDVPLL